MSARSILAGRTARQLCNDKRSSTTLQLKELPGGGGGGLQLHRSTQPARPASSRAAFRARCTVHSACGSVQCHIARHGTNSALRLFALAFFFSLLYLNRTELMRHAEKWVFDAITLRRQLMGRHNFVGAMLCGSSGAGSARR